jgi:hypothetical protein
MKFLIFFFFLHFFNHSAFARDPKLFTTDFCTAYPEGTLSRPYLWRHCCIEHDLFFWAGGSLDDRKKTDLELKACVEKTGESLQAKLIYIAVTVGGKSPLRFKSRQWGNAWTGRTRYESLSESETYALLETLEREDLHVSTELKQSFRERLLSRLDSK